jgi:RNA polymerase sigma-70 factor, ECF subfamily
MGTQILRAETEAAHRPKEAEPTLEFEEIFQSQYPRIARLMARVIRDWARAEELSVEVFLKFWRSPAVRVGNAPGWLHRVAVRGALDELRRRTRSRYESLFRLGHSTPTPEELRGLSEGQERVRNVLAVIDRRDAELLLLRSQGWSYSELASTLGLNPVSIGTLLLRAQQAFGKEYMTCYGKH